MFMHEWVVIFREGSLRDDVTVQNLQAACLKLVVAARVRARELQVDPPVEKANKAIVANAVIFQPAKQEPIANKKALQILRNC